MQVDFVKNNIYLTQKKGKKDNQSDCKLKYESNHFRQYFHSLIALIDFVGFKNHNCSHFLLFIT